MISIEQASEIVKRWLGKRTLIMGILNVTPDSFSDGGAYPTAADAAARAKAMLADGADLLDIGGESTRPGHEPVSLEEELARVLPALARIAEETDAPISVDTYKAETARQALRNGAHIINDIWGGRKDPEILRVAAEFGCPIILMHNREEAVYADLLAEIKADLAECAESALRAGIAPENIWLDPGIGFGKTFEHNLEVMRRLPELRELGYPLLLGTSRKRFIRTVLERGPLEVVEGTAATTALGIASGADIVRVHDVAEMKRVASMTDAMVRGTW